MNTVNVTLEQVLQFRDERCRIQRELIDNFKAPLISFTLNIAGPCKRTSLTEFCFNDTLKRLRLRFGVPVAYKELRCAAGCEAFFVYELEAEKIKEGCVELEEAGPVGRLLDIDVIGRDGVKLARREPRRCLICGAPAGPCARSRRHSVEELAKKTNGILKQYAVDTVAELAVQALLDEVRLTPKPGLVDAEDSGANKDMDIALMEKSACSLRGYFKTAAELGFDYCESCAGSLQAAGIEAERTMFAATGGVNTHKGAIFSLGLLCAGVGVSLGGGGDDPIQNAAAIAAGLGRGETPSHGTEVKKRYAVGGARAEAEAGFPHVKLALNALRGGASPLTALLTLLEVVEDSNLLWRGGTEGLAFMRRAAADILSAPEYEREARVRALNLVCIEKNLNPGGSADLLADALFLRSLDAAAWEE